MDFDDECLRNHGRYYEDVDDGSDSGKSEFDEYYKEHLPPPFDLKQLQEQSSNIESIKRICVQRHIEITKEKSIAKKEKTLINRDIFQKIASTKKKTQTSPNKIEKPKQEICSKLQKINDIKSKQHNANVQAIVKKRQETRKQNQAKSVTVAIDNNKPTCSYKVQSTNIENRQKGLKNTTVKVNSKTLGNDRCVARRTKEIGKSVTPGRSVMCPISKQQLPMNSNIKLLSSMLETNMKITENRKIEIKSTSKTDTKHCLGNGQQNQLNKVEGISKTLQNCGNAQQKERKEIQSSAKYGSKDLRPITQIQSGKMNISKHKTNTKTAGNTIINAKPRNQAVIENLLTNCDNKKPECSTKTRKCVVNKQKLLKNTFQIQVNNTQVELAQRTLTNRKRKERKQRAKARKLFVVTLLNAKKVANNFNRESEMAIKENKVTMKESTIKTCKKIDPSTVTKINHGLKIVNQEKLLNSTNLFQENTISNSPTLQNQKKIKVKIPKIAKEPSSVANGRKVKIHSLLQTISPINSNMQLLTSKYGVNRNTINEANCTFNKFGDDLYKIEEHTCIKITEFDKGIIKKDDVNNENILFGIFEIPKTVLYNDALQCIDYYFNRNINIETETSLNISRKPRKKRKIKKKSAIKQHKLNNKSNCQIFEIPKAVLYSDALQCIDYYFNSNIMGVNKNECGRNIQRDIDFGFIYDVNININDQNSNEMEKVHKVYNDIKLTRTIEAAEEAISDKINEKNLNRYINSVHKTYENCLPNYWKINKRILRKKHREIFNRSKHVPLTDLLVMVTSDILYHFNNHGFRLKEELENIKQQNLIALTNRLLTNNTENDKFETKTQYNFQPITECKPHLNKNNMEELLETTQTKNKISIKVGSMHDIPNNVLDNEKLDNLQELLSSKNIISDACINIPNAPKEDNLKELVLLKNIITDTSTCMLNVPKQNETDLEKLDIKTIMNGAISAKTVKSKKKKKKRNILIQNSPNELIEETSKYNDFLKEKTNGNPDISNNLLENENADYLKEFELSKNIIDNASIDIPNDQKQNKTDIEKLENKINMNEAISVESVKSNKKKKTRNKFIKNTTNEASEMPTRFFIDTRYKREDNLNSKYRYYNQQKRLICYLTRIMVLNYKTNNILELYFQKDFFFGDPFIHIFNFYSTHRQSKIELKDFYKFEKYISLTKRQYDIYNFDNICYILEPYFDNNSGIVRYKQQNVVDLKTLFQVPYFLGILTENCYIYSVRDIIKRKKTIIEKSNWVICLFKYMPKLFKKLLISISILTIYKLIRYYCRRIHFSSY